MTWSIRQELQHGVGNCGVLSLVATRLAIPQSRILSGSAAISWTRLDRGGRVAGKTEAAVRDRPVVPSTDNLKSASYCKRDRLLVIKTDKKIRYYYGVDKCVFNALVEGGHRHNWWTQSLGPNVIKRSFKRRRP